jgi:hypothetical protein
MIKRQGKSIENLIGVRLRAKEKISSAQSSREKVKLEDTLRNIHGTFVIERYLESEAPLSRLRKISDVESVRFQRSMCERKKRRRRGDDFRKVGHDVQSTKQGSVAIRREESAE